MRKILTVVGTRPELIKMSMVIRKFDRLTDHVLVHTGQNYDYELNQIFFEDLGIRKPDHFLDAAGPSAVATIARVIERSDEVFAREKPDAVLIYGDTNSGLSVISAKRQKIPIFHMEAGNRCFDQRVPEEVNRKIIDHLSDVNMVLTEHARRYLIAEGLPSQRIFKVGSHLAEVLAEFGPKIAASTILTDLGLEKDRFFVVSAHREENVDSPERLTAFVEELHRLHEAFGFPIIVSMHPRTRARLDGLGHADLPAGVRFLRPFGFTDYVRLQTCAYCVLSDSGTITEEASLLDLPAVTFRDAHERPEGMDAGTLVVAPLGKSGFVEAVRTVRDGYTGSRRFSGAVDDYNASDVSTKIVRIVLSNIDYVNEVVWSKNAAG
ncbi:non-hydrolyzing UDP-N-acetylglucosamine 2-epimerase [Methylobacterium mesophilicum]